MKFSVQLPIQWHGQGEDFHDGATIGRHAAEIEAQGFDACFVTEHPAPSQAWMESGGHATLDPFVALSFAAAGSRKLALHTNILVLSYRNPLLTAKAVASLDVLSGGRVICGVGVGYMEAEFRALGASFKRRGASADEALEVLHKAWTGAPISHQGETFEAKDNVVQPRPLQRPHPPIWVGGNSDHALTRAVRYATGWSPFPTQRSGVTQALATMADLEDRIRYLRELERAAQRAPLDVCMVPFGWSMTDRAAAPSSAELVEQLQALRAMGVTWTVLALEADSSADYRDRLQALGRDVLPKLRN